VAATHKEDMMRQSCILLLILTSTVTVVNPSDARENEQHEHGDEDGEVSFVLGVNIDALATNNADSPSLLLEHADPLIGCQFTRSSYNNGVTVSALLAIGTGPNRSFLPSYLVDIHIELQDPSFWIGIELEGHLDEDEDEGIHTHFPNTILSIGSTFAGTTHLGGGVDFFFAGEDVGHGAGPALILGWHKGNVHLHGHFSAGSSFKNKDFMSRISLHIMMEFR